MREPKQARRRDMREGHVLTRRARNCAESNAPSDAATRCLYQLVSSNAKVVHAAPRLYLGEWLRDLKSFENMAEGCPGGREGQGRRADLEKWGRKACELVFEARSAYMFQAYIRAYLRSLLHRVGPSVQYLGGARGRRRGDDEERLARGQSRGPVKYSEGSRCVRSQ
jgi:hypothetical protein